jgi:hypothetical protein
MGPQAHPRLLGHVREPGLHPRCRRCARVALPRRRRANFTAQRHRDSPSALEEMETAPGNDCTTPCGSGLASLAATTRCGLRPWRHRRLTRPCLGLDPCRGREPTGLAIPVMPGNATPQVPPPAQLREPLVLRKVPEGTCSGKCRRGRAPENAGGRGDGSGLGSGQRTRALQQRTAPVHTSVWRRHRLYRLDLAATIVVVSATAAVVTG